MPVIQLRDLSGEWGLSLTSMIRVDLGEVAERYLVRSGDVLFRSRGDRYTATALDSRWTSPAVAVLPLVILRPDPRFLTADFLAWAINQPAAQLTLDSKAYGTKLQMIPKSILADLEIDVPDLATQRAIVAVAELAERECSLVARLAAKRLDRIRLALAERAVAGAERNRR